MIPHELHQMVDQSNHYSLVEENFDLSAADVATVLVVDKLSLKYNLYLIVRDKQENQFSHIPHLVQNCKPVDLEHAKIFYPHLDYTNYGF